MQCRHVQILYILGRHNDSNRGQDSELRVRAVPRVSLGRRLLASVFARGRSHSQGLNATGTLQNGDTLPLNQ